VLHPEATQTRTRRRLWLGRLRHQSTEGVGTERIAHVEAGGLNSGGLSTYHLVRVVRLYYMSSYE
jgi:hypothetical protein